MFRLFRLVFKLFWSFIVLGWRIFHTLFFLFFGTTLVLIASGVFVPDPLPYGEGCKSVFFSTRILLILVSCPIFYFIAVFTRASTLKIAVNLFTLAILFWTVPPEEGMYDDLLETAKFANTRCMHSAVQVVIALWSITFVTGVLFLNPKLKSLKKQSHKLGSAGNFE